MALPRCARSARRHRCYNMILTIRGVQQTFHCGQQGYRSKVMMFLPMLSASCCTVQLQGIDRHRLALQRLANNFGMINATVPTVLNLVDFAHRLVGPKPLEYVSSVLNRASRNFVPEWNPYMPRVSPAQQLMTQNAPILAQCDVLGLLLLYFVGCRKRLVPLCATCTGHWWLCHANSNS